MDTTPEPGPDFLRAVFLSLAGPSLGFGSPRRNNVAIFIAPTSWLDRISVVDRGHYGWNLLDILPLY